MRADRLISLMMLLQTRGRMTAQQLAEELEVSTRTIYRDLDALSISGVPVYTERGPEGGCMLLESYRTNLTGMKEEEVRALFMFAVPGLLADLGADKASEAALLKLSAAVPAPFQQDAARVRERIHLDPTGWFQPAESTPHLQTIQEAIWQQRRLRMAYRTARGNWNTFLIDPYGLVAKTSIWYLVGVRRHEPAVFRVSRVQEASVTDSQFERPSDFDLATFWQEWTSSFELSRQRYFVTLHVFPIAIPVLVEVFGDWMQRMIEFAEDVAADGSFTLNLTFGSMTEACRQLAGLGDGIEVLEPAELREEMRRQAGRLLARYA